MPRTVNETFIFKWFFTENRKNVSKIPKGWKNPLKGEKIRGLFLDLKLKSNLFKTWFRVMYWVQTYPTFYSVFHPKFSKLMKLFLLHYFYTFIRQSNSDLFLRTHFLLDHSFFGYRNKYMYVTESEIPISYGPYDTVCKIWNCAIFVLTSKPRYFYIIRVCKNGAVSKFTHDISVLWNWICQKNIGDICRKKIEHD